MDKKGITLVEIIVSLALISIVLIFLLNLFVSVRGTYNTSKLEADYDMIVANVIDAVSNDISTYGLLKVEEITSVSNHAAYLLTFNTYRPSKLSQRIEKVLEVFADTKDGKLTYYISYTYNTKYEGSTFKKSTDIVGEERLTNITRKVPNEAILDTTRFIHINTLDSKATLGKKAIRIKIPLSNPNGTIYDINIYGLIPN